MMNLILVLAEGDSSLMGNILMGAGVLLLLTIMMINFRKKLARTENLDPRERVERQRHMNSPKDDLRSMMVELEEVTRQFSAQLDAKSRRLETLIEKADQCIAALESREGGPAIDGQPLADNGAQEFSPPPKPQDDPLTRSVYQLADEGLETGEIARRLEEHVGKVELILALRQHG